MNGRLGWALDLGQKVRARMPGQHRVRLSRYWEARAPELIRGYDDPGTWAERRWIPAHVENELVPQLLLNAGVRSVVVVGCGSGREYRYLAPHGFELCGLDVSPTMVAACRERFPHISTELGSVVGAESRLKPVDAAVVSAVLAHVPPADIEAAAKSVTGLARKLVVLHEKTHFDEPSDYQWAHDYDRLLRGWTCVHRQRTDGDATFTTELMAWEATASSKR